MTFFDAFDRARDTLFNLFNTGIKYLPEIVLSILVLLLSFLLARLFSRYSKRLSMRFTKNESVSHLISSVVSLLVLLFALFIIMDIFQLDKALTTLLTGAGVVGLAVGLAVQEPLINTTSGVMMSMRDFYRIGDVVRTNGFTGTISKITMRYTILNKPSGEQVILPNKLVIQNPMENLSRKGILRVDLEVGVHYDSPLSRVQEVTEEAIAEEFPDMRSERIEVFFTEFASSSINLVARYWIPFSTIRDYKEAVSRAMVAIKKSYDKEGITIPFPMRTIDFSYNDLKANIRRLEEGQQNDKEVPD